MARDIWMVEFYERYESGVLIGVAESEKEARAMATQYVLLEEKRWNVPSKNNPEHEPLWHWIKKRDKKSCKGYGEKNNICLWERMHIDMYDQEESVDGGIHMTKFVTGIIPKARW